MAETQFLPLPALICAIVAIIAATIQILVLCLITFNKSKIYNQQRKKINKIEKSVRFDKFGSIKYRSLLNSINSVESDRTQDSNLTMDYVCEPDVFE